MPAPPVGLDVLIGLDFAVGPEVPPADVLLLAHPDRAHVVAPGLRAEHVELPESREVLGVEGRRGGRDEIARDP